MLFRACFICLVIMASKITILGFIFVTSEAYGHLAQQVTP